jgi:hypothetical protein
MSAETIPLHRLTRIFRSKNAGPFVVTVDMFFRDEGDYFAVKELGLITRELVTARYGIPLEEVIAIHYWDAALAIKVAFRRQVGCGAINDTDCYGAQQHAPLLDIPVPVRTVAPAPAV